MIQSTENGRASRTEEHMLGHGFYNKHSHEQAKANTYALPRITKAISRIDLAQIGCELRVADYGSAQGQNSLCADENCDRANLGARCQMWYSNNSDFRYTHRFANKRLDHALPNGSLLTR
jgi:hypothetical protein